jgi:hypothetical protein
LVVPPQAKVPSVTTWTNQPEWVRMSLRDRNTHACQLPRFSPVRVSHVVPRRDRTVGV